MKFKRKNFGEEYVFEEDVCEDDDVVIGWIEFDKKNDKFIFEQGEYENLPLRKLKQIEFHLRQLKKEFDGKEVISNL